MSLKQFTFEQQQHEIKAAADRERRRIRSAQKHARDWLRNMAARFLSELDAATRAKKGKRK